MILGAIDSPGAITGLYLAAAALALSAGVSELIGRFKDEPLEVLRGRPGLVYLLLNAGLGAVVLLGLRFASDPDTTVVALEQVLLAGFGARLLVRTKVVGLPGSEQDIGPGEVFGVVTMHLFVRGNCTMVAAPVQCDVDRIPKWSHQVRPSSVIGPPNAPVQARWANA